MSTPRTRERTVRLDERLLEKKVEQWQEELNRAYLKALCAREPTPKRAGRMVSIREGVMELDWGSDRFQAAVDTDEGPKTLEGSVLGRSDAVDIQSGAKVSAVLSEWQLGMAEVANAIRRAYENLQPAEALRIISEVWGRLDQTTELAAARSRILMAKVARPDLARAPEWFEQQKANLTKQQEGDLPANPLAVASAELLVRATVAVVNDASKFRADVDVGALGRVILDWVIPESRLQWMVEGIEFPWPSVKVYELKQRANGPVSEPPKTQTLHSAFDAIDSFARFIRDN